SESRARRPLVSRMFATAAVATTMLEGAIFAFPMDLRYVVAGGFLVFAWARLPDSLGDRLLLGFGAAGCVTASLDLLRHDGPHAGMPMLGLSSMAALLYGLTMISIVAKAHLRKGKRDDATP
ncbi:MAG: hypothetical protein ABL977_05115, partial [Candidatus Eisenbacteria bacterium]